MAKIVFECTRTRADGVKLYRLMIDGVTVREDLTIDEVIEAINRRDEESLRRDVRRTKLHDARFERTADAGPEATR